MSLTTNFYFAFYLWIWGLMSEEYYFSIPGKEGDDPIVIFSRRHIVSFLGYIFIFLFLFILPIIVFSIYFNISAEIIISRETTVIMIIMLSVYYLMLATYSFLEWINYYYDFIVVTTKVVVDMKQINLFKKHMSLIHLSQIRDIQSDIQGFFPSLFAFGNVIIETAGSEEPTVLTKIPNPQQIAATIYRLHQDFIEGKEFGQEDQTE